MGELVYAPPKSVQGFLQSDKFINLIVGPVGSTKTTAGIIKISYEAARIAPCRDGVRRSKCIWIRNTREQLRDTTLPDFLKWFPDGVAGAFAKTEFKFILKFDDVECEVLFRGLDDANDVRRLLSLNATFAVMDEFREINPDIFEVLQSRIGRYPDSSMNGVGCKDDHGVQMDKIWGMSNPPDMDTYWEEKLTNPPDNWAVFFQPSGLSPEADWVQYLKENYYANLAEGKTQDWIDVYIHAEFGKSLSGQPVFRCFDRSIHVASSVPNLLTVPLIIGIDAGLNPSAVLTQQTYDGRVVVHAAVTGNAEGMGALRFSREILKPLLNNSFRSIPSVALIIDPSANARADSDEKSVMDIFKAEGFAVQAASTNAIAARLGAVENYLTRQINGNPGMLISPTATLVIRGLAGAYRYKVNTKGVADDTPEKSHPISDVADALQYACLHHDGGRMFGRAQSRRRQVKVASAGGWT